MHYWCKEKKATCVSYETETDNSSSEIAGRLTSASNATMDVIKTDGRDQDRWSSHVQDPLFQCLVF